MIKDEQGYTVIEVLVALALLTGVLFPVGRLFSTIVYKDRTHDKLIALSLAKEELENCTALGEYASGTRTVRWNKRNWVVKKDVKGTGGMKEVKVEVMKKGQKTALVTLETVRMGR